MNPFTVTCPVCGAVVGDTVTHLGYHEQLQAIATAVLTLLDVLGIEPEKESDSET